MKQGLITDIKKIGSYLNPNTNAKNYKYDVYFDNDDCGQFRTILEEQNKYKVGQQLKYKIEKVGFNGGAWLKLIDLSQPTYKAKNKQNNNSLYKRIDVAVECQKQAIQLLKREIDHTTIQDENDLIFDRIGAITERLYNQVFSISKL